MVRQLLGQVLCCLLLLGQVLAQPVRIKVQTDSDSILLGDRCFVRCQVTVARDVELDNESLQWKKQFEQAGWEVLDASPMQEQRDDKATVLIQTLVLTGWDEGPKAIPPLTIRLRNGDPFRSDSILLRIVHPSLPEQDTLFQSPMLEEPVLWSDYRDWYGLPALYVLAGILALALIYQAIRYARLRPSMPPSADPRAWAMEQLAKIRQADHLRKGEYKLLHSRLSYLMRLYLERSFPDTPALKMPVSEIFKAKPGHALPYALAERLQEVLETADLIKYAKASPLETANQEALAVAELLFSFNTNPSGDKK